MSDKFSEVLEDNKDWLRWQIDDVIELLNPDRLKRRQGKIHPPPTQEQMIRALVTSIYHRGVEHGKEIKMMELREVLGIKEDCSVRY